MDGAEGRKDDRMIYTNEVTELLECESYDEFEALYKEKQVRWSEPFVEYFRTHLLPRVQDYGYWSVSKLINLQQGQTLTTNQSEGFNTLVINS